MTSRTFRVLVVLAGFAAALWIGYLLRAVLNPFLLSALFAYMLNPLVGWMEHRGFRRFRAILLLYAVGTVLLALTLTYAGPKLVRASIRSTKWVGQALRSQPSVGGDAFVDRLKEHARRIPYYTDGATLLSFFTDEPKNAHQIKERTARVLAWCGERFFATLRGLFTLFSYLVLAPLYTFYLLEKIPDLKREIPGLFPPRYREKTLSVLRQIDLAMAGFIFGRILVCLLKGVIVAIGLAALGVPYAILCGLLVAVLSLLPAASLIVGGGLAMLLGWFTAGTSGMLVGVALVFILSEVVEAIANPIILGRTASLHPIMIIFAMLAFGKLLGLFGVLLAVPLASATKILWREILRPYVDQTWAEQTG